MTTDIKSVSTADLIAELHKRGLLDREAAKPKMVAEPDIEALKKCCQEYIDTIDADGFVREDEEHYIFETAMECLFGNGVFEWVNKNMNMR